MLFITSQEILSRVFSNEVVVVEGEKTLFDKISLEIAASEDWLISQILGDATANAVTADTALFNMCVTAVGCDALRRAIPSLDLVLTPNGFGIVSNTNVAPASKDRVERLIESCLERRDFAISRIYPQLFQLASWQDSAQRKFLYSSPLQDMEAVESWDKRNDYASRYDALLAMRDAAAVYVTKLAERYISFEVMERVSAAMCSSDTSEDAANDRVLGKKLVNILIALLNGKMFHYKLVYPIVNYLRENDEDWRASSVAELYATPSFKNTKESTGYWF